LKTDDVTRSLDSKASLSEIGSGGGGRRGPDGASIAEQLRALEHR
jgi:hypothetical protein